MSRRILAILSDLHSGSTIGLMPPKVITDDGMEIRQSQGQKWMWKLWLKYWRMIYELAGDDELHVIVNGDLIEGDHHNTTQIWSKRIKDQKDAAVECLLVPSNRCTQMYITRGTVTHVGESGTVEDDIAKELGAYQLKSHPHLELDVGGVRFDIAHHGASRGRRWWTQTNAWRHILHSEMIRSLEEGKKPPHYIVRSHVHKAPPPVTERMDWRNVLYETTGIITPAWQLKTEFGHKISNGELSDIGMYVIEIEGDRHWWERWMVRWDSTTRVTV